MHLEHSLPHLMFALAVSRSTLDVYTTKISTVHRGLCKSIANILIIWSRLVNIKPFLLVPTGSNTKLLITDFV